MNSHQLSKLVSAFLLIVCLSSTRSNAFIDFGKDMFMTPSISEQNSFSESEIEFQEIMADVLPEKQSEEYAIEIFDENLNLIAFGSECDSKINSLLQKSDLITKVPGKKYFRLGY
jgi:hypothetical protein